MKTASVFRLFLIGLAALLALVPQAASFASTPVDPSTLIPPPFAGSNAVCSQIGLGTICHIQFSDPPLVNDPNTIQCGTGPNAYELFFLTSQSRSVNGRRFYDQDKKLLQRHYRETFSGTYLNPATGTVLGFAGDDTVIHNLSIPGDITSGTISVTGSFRVFRPQDGRVLIDAGTSLFTAPEYDETLIRQAGQHPFNDYYLLGNVAALQPLCDALK